MNDENMEDSISYLIVLIVILLVFFGIASSISKSHKAQQTPKPTSIHPYTPQYEAESRRKQYQETVIAGASLSMPNGQIIAIDREVIIGRDNFTHLLPEELLAKISRNHFRVWKIDEIPYIEDGFQGQPSTNGTFLNGSEIQGRGVIRLKSGDIIRPAKIIDIRVL